MNVDHRRCDNVGHVGRVSDSIISNMALIAALKLFGAYATAAHVPGGELPTSLVGADDGFSLQTPQKMAGNDESF